MKQILLFLLISLCLFTPSSFAGSVDLATGSHTQDFELFDTGIEGYPSRMTLSYTSRSPYNGPMGRKWTHTFDLYLKDNGSTMLQKDISGFQHLYGVKDGIYEDLDMGRTTMVKGEDGGYVIKVDDLTYLYDKNRLLTAIVAPNGEKAQFTHTNGKLAKMATPNKQTIIFAYGDDGRLSQIMDPAGKRYTISYGDEALSAITNPDGSAWRFTYDPKAFMLTKSGPKGEMVTYAYEEGWTVSATDENGETQYVEYPDKRSTVRSASITENGKTTKYTFNVHEGTTSETVDPNGGVTTYSHDALGNLTSETDPSGRTTSYTYEKNRMTSRRDPDGTVTMYRYDDKGKLVEVEDPVQGKSEYDDRGRLLRITSPDGQTVTYRYDANGNLDTIVGPDGKTMAVPANLGEGVWE